jgi:hypothetical protein
VERGGDDRNEHAGSRTWAPDSDPARDAAIAIRCSHLCQPWRPSQLTREAHGRHTVPGPWAIQAVPPVFVRIKLK